MSQSAGKKFESKMTHTEETKQKIRVAVKAHHDALGIDGRKEKYGKQNKGKVRSKKWRKHLSNTLKQDYASGKRVSAIMGKSIKSFMSAEVFAQRNANISKTRKARFISGKIVHHAKGKKYEELYDKETSTRLKENISRCKSGENAPMANLASRQKMIASVKQSFIDGRELGHPNYARGGIREDLGHYVRSRWEANICRLLKYLNKPYQYEGYAFSLIKDDGSICAYYPDIYLLDLNIFLEVKGGYYNKTEKYDLFKSQYRKQYFTGLVDYRAYKALSRKYRKIVPYWDDKPQTSTSTTIR